MTKLLPPIPNFSWDKCSQLFGFNPAIYARFNLPGHNGIDIRGEYGSPVLAAHDGYITSLTLDVPQHTKGNGIYLQTLDNSFQTLYWHLSLFNNIAIGQKVNAGDVIGFMGNSGFVLPAPTPQNPHASTHLHWGIKIPNRKNEYGGNVDPTPYLFNEGDKLPYKLVYDLWYGYAGDSVAMLQTCLKLEFPDITFEPIGYFGRQTGATVKRLQQKYLLSPVLGYVGPKTRRVLNQRYSAY